MSTDVLSHARHAQGTWDLYAHLEPQLGVQRLSLRPVWKVMAHTCTGFFLRELRILLREQTLKEEQATRASKLQYS